MNERSFSKRVVLPPGRRELVEVIVDYPFRPIGAHVPDDTPHAIVLHTPGLAGPTPIAIIFSSVSFLACDPAVWDRSKKLPGEAIVFDVENLGGERVELEITVTGDEAGR